MFDENPNEQLADKAREQVRQGIEIDRQHTCEPAALIHLFLRPLSACTPSRNTQDLKTRFERVLEIVVPFVFHSCDGKKAQNGAPPALVSASGMVCAPNPAPASRVPPPFAHFASPGKGRPPACPKKTTVHCRR